MSGQETHHAAFQIARMKTNSLLRLAGDSQDSPPLFPPKRLCSWCLHAIEVNFLWDSVILQCYRALYAKALCKETQTQTKLLHILGQNTTDQCTLQPVKDLHSILVVTCFLRRAIPQYWLHQMYANFQHLCPVL